MIELQGRGRPTGAFTAGPEVKNFAQIRVGDKVVVSYYRGIAAELPPKARRVEEGQSDRPGDLGPAGRDARGGRG